VYAVYGSKSGVNGVITQHVEYFETIAEEGVVDDLQEMTHIPQNRQNIRKLDYVAPMVLFELFPALPYVSMSWDVE
jgi:hypothetical protein